MNLSNHAIVSKKREARLSLFAPANKEKKNSYSEKNEKNASGSHGIFRRVRKNVESRIDRILSGGRRGTFARI